jgi:hypothetical protein
VNQQGSGGAKRFRCSWCFAYNDETAERCTICRLRRGERRLGSVRELGLVVLGVFAILTLFGGFAGMSGGNGEQQVATTQAPDATAAVDPGVATDPPTPKPDRHAQRQVEHDYWERIIEKGAVAQSALTLAGAALLNEDRASAYEILKKAKTVAFDAANESSDGVPDGWDDVKDHLSNAFADYGTAYDTMAGALDSDKPSEYAQAREYAQSAQDEFDQAVHLARVHYVDMGGRWQDVSDGTAEAKSMQDMLKALSGAGQ